MEITVKDHQQWQGVYRGVVFEVVRWGTGSEMGHIWNYYIYVKPRKTRTTAGWKPGTRRFDYSKMYHDVTFHGGITYMSEVVESEDTKKKMHRIGCDYGHSWDMDDGITSFRVRTLEHILPDVKETIDKLPADLLFASNKIYTP